MRVGDEQVRPVDARQCAPVQMPATNETTNLCCHTVARLCCVSRKPLLLVVEVDHVHDLLLSIFHDLPDRSSDHVTSWQRCDLKTVTFALQTDGLRVLDLLDAVERCVDVVQREEAEILSVVSRLKKFK